MKKLFSLIMVLLLLVGCSGGNGGNGGGGSDATVRTVTVQAPTPIISMDHHIATDGTSFIAQTMIISGLMELDANGNPLPDMAESYEMSDDGLVYTFKIRDDANWSNGDPVTANDFVYGWNRLVDPDTASDYSWILETACVESYEAVDDKTFKVTLGAPTGFFLALTAFPSFFPMNQKFVEEKGDQYSLTPNDLLFNGPYVMTSWTSGYSFEFELNPNYWNAAEYAEKYAEKVVFREITDTQTALMEYESGNLDNVTLSGEQVDANKDVAGFINKLTGYMYYLSINMGNNVHERDGAANLANANVRQAILYAIDRDEIARVLNDGSVAANGIIPIGLASNPSTGKDFRDDAGAVVAYDVDKAKEYYAAAVAELGHDVTFELLYGTDEGDSIIKAAEQIQYYLEQVGFTVNLNGKPKKERLDLAGNANDHDYDVMLTRWGPDYGDPQTYMDLFVSTNSSNNDGGYNSADYDALVADAEGGAGATDADVRWKDFLAAEVQLVKTDAAVVPVFQAGGAMIINPAVTGIEFHSAAVDSYRHIQVNR
ncbi:MAG: peptide ABC transporter substrate-binding protein [Erysipelotrichaceae bacterium]|nr:peptide ABC transporter substrate-binding protein [Erysipelotrichaceae bacterium]MBQ6493188.1 peptide ABC transporter substrate-binding protein [Erysipelotrichaceae bacterium]